MVTKILNEIFIRFYGSQIISRYYQISFDFDLITIVNVMAADKLTKFQY